MPAWLAVAIAVSVGAGVKGITGMGLPPVALPVLAIFVGVHDAVVIMAIPTVVTNTALITGNWDVRRANRHLPATVLAAVAGGACGAWLLTSLDERFVAVLLGTLVVAYIASRLLQPDWVLAGTAARRVGVLAGAGGGVLQGSAGLSSPVFATYLHALAIPQRVFVFSIASLFQISAAAQIVGLLVLGRYDLELLGLSVLAAALALLVLLAVRPLAQRVPHAVFDKLVLLVLAGSTSKMLVDALV